MWTIEKKRLSSSKRCGDNVEIDQQLDFQTAKFEAQKLERLRSHLDKLRQLRTIESTMHTFDRAAAYFHVEQYLNSVLQDPNLVALLNKMSASCVTNSSLHAGSYAGFADLDLVPDTINFFETLPAGSPLASAVDHLKYCIDVLVFFEKKVTLEEKGLFSRIPQSFYRGEMVMQGSGGKVVTHGGGSHKGMERKVKCYACGSLNPPMAPNQWCRLCEACEVVLYMPPSSVSTKSNEWYSSVLRFRQSLQKWISTCLQTLLRTKSLSNMPFLLMHVMYLPRIATDERSWVLRFLQFPRGMVSTDGSLKLEWNEDLVDHYLAMMHLVFHPEKLRRMAILVSSGPTTALAKSKVKPKKFDEDGLVSPEWVLLENPEMLDRYFLSDDDFVAVLNQFPNSFAFEQLFRCTSDVKKCFSRALTLVLEFMNSLRAFQEFDKLPSRVAQLLGELLAYAAQMPEVVATRARADEAIFYPTLFDQLFLTTLNGLMLADSNRVAWKYLSCFPFESLTEPAKWDVLALLLFNLPNVPAEAKNASGWMRFVNSRSTGGGADGRQPVRHVLYDLITHDTDSAVHLLSAVANLAASCPSDRLDAEKHHNDLVAVAVHELFVAGYTVPTCKVALGVNGDRAAVPISQICLAHPWIISLLITLLFKYHECAETWIHVFETFPVNRWIPSMHDLLTIQEWLQLEETGAPRCQLARFLLDHINWEYDAKREQLFTGAGIHRRVALIVAEALVLYKTRRERATDPATAVVVSGSGAPQKLEVAAITKSIRRALWLDESVDFEKWCWKLMLKLKFYSPKTHEPYLRLIDVQRDRSRDALTLRRWFSAISTNTSLLHADIPFYFSVEDEVLRWGQRGDESGSGTAGSSESMHSGAPIHEVAVAVGGGASDNPGETNDADADAQTAAQTTEPIVAYAICQMTSFLFTDRLDRWEPLLVLLKRSMFAAAVKVIDNVLPVLSALDRKKRLLGATPSAEAESAGVPDDGAIAMRTRVNSRESELVDHEIDVCMAAIQSLSIADLLELIRALHQFSYINAEELHRMQEVLHKGYIGGWESTAKARVQSRLRFIRSCCRYMHPVVLLALINECFPESNPVALTTSALLHGAMSWLSTALRGGDQDGASSSAISSVTSALSIRNSSLIANASLGILKGTSGVCTASARALATLIERMFEYSMDDSVLAEFATIWLRALLQVPYWYENYAFRHLVDVLLRCAMGHDFAVRRRITASQEGDATAKKSPAMMFDMVARFQQIFGKYCSALKRRKEQPDHPTDGFLEDEPASPVVSFLPASNSSTAFSSIFGGAGDVAEYVEGSPHLALWLLLIETRQELPLFMAMGQLMIKCEPKTTKKVHKMQAEGKLSSALAELGCVNTSPVVSSTGSMVHSRPFQFGHSTFESLAQFRIYRWCAYCLELPESEGAQILYWQTLFALYFACVGGSHVFGHYFLERNKRVSLRTELQVKLRKMTNYCSNQAQLALTATSRDGSTAPTSSSGAMSECKEKKYAHFVTLSQIYTAMDAWLEDPDPNSWLKANELVSLPRHYEVKRLEQVLTLSDALVNTSPDAFDWAKLPLWIDLCGLEDTPWTSRHSHVLAGLDTDGNSINGAAHQLGSSMDGTADDDGFAFVEEAAELARRHSSFGGFGIGSGSNSVLNIRPLPLTREFAGVSTLTVLPKVAVVTNPSSCVVTPSIPLNQPGLKSVGIKFSENMSVLVALDTEMLDHVSQLYSSKPRTVTLSQACMEGTNCRSPAQFRFEFLEWSIDSRLSDAIESILSQAERCDLQSMLLSNVTSLMMEHHDASAIDAADESGISSDSIVQPVDSFLKLDADGMMLSIQILLIDQIVLSLDVERQRLNREKQAAETRALSDSRPVGQTDGEGDEERSMDDLKGEDESSDEDVAALWQRKLDRLNEKGLEWFRLLTTLDTKLARMVPPLREVLWRSIKQLGLSFVCVDERETCTLLQLMLDDPSRINLLSECFFPAGAPSRFVEMFSNLMSASSSSKLSSEEKLSLLRRFDFRAWLSAKPAPTKFDRETILCIILGDIGSQFAADRAAGTKAATNMRRDGPAMPSRDDREHLRSVLGVYATTLRLICSKHLEDHVEKVLHALVGVHDDYHFHVNSGNDGDASATSGGGPPLPRPADAAVWEALVAVPSEAWQALPFVVVESCISFLSQHVRTLRWQGAMASTGSDDASSEKMSAAPDVNSARKYPIAQWQRLGVLKHFLDVFTILCRAAPDTHKWELIVQFFEPLLSTLYQPATTTDMSSINAPWTDQDAVTTGTTLCSCFVATCSEYLKGGISNLKPSATPIGGVHTNRRTSLDILTADAPNNSASAAASTGAKLSEIWAFYLSALVPHAPLHVCKHFHQFVTRLAWEHWCLTPENVQQMRELVETEKQQYRTARATAPSFGGGSFTSSMMMMSSMSSAMDNAGHQQSSPYPFISWLVRDILCRTKWKATEEWLAAQSDDVASTFLLEFSKLCVDLVLDLPHFWPVGHGAPQRGRMMALSSSSSSNVLPPYFVNFIKQQAMLWSRWSMSDADLKSLLQYALDACLEPLLAPRDARGNASADAHGCFPASPSTGVMQDAFARVQLALRLLSQATTIHHTALTKKQTFARANLMLDTLFNVFDVNDLGRLDGNVYASDRSAWLVVVYGASCTVLYEKLDEIVQFSRRDDAISNSNTANRGAEGSSAQTAAASTLTEEELTTTVMHVLRFCNLSLVERFFRMEQQQPSTGSGHTPRGGSTSGGSMSLNWSKCGNVLFVEVDSLVRDFATSQKPHGQHQHQWNGNGNGHSAALADVHDDASTGAEDGNPSAIATVTVATVGHSPAEAIGAPLGRLLWSFLGFRGGERACLAACGRAIASVHVMSQVAEKSIEKWVIEERRGSWADLAERLKVPELSEDEFETACLELGKLLTLQVLFLQHLRRAPVLTEAFAMGMLSRLMAWMRKLRVGNSRNSLTEMKVLFLAAEAVNFVCKTLADVLPSQHKKQALRELSDALLEMGDERKNSGIMKAIGMGGSLKYNVEFHVCCLAVGVFLRLQTRGSVPLRVDERIPFKVTRTTDKHLRSLEHLLTTKDCIQLAKRMEWMLEFVKSPSRSLADQDEFFVSLFSRMYPSHPWLLAKCLQ